ncbi:MAG: NFACT family protein, partial [Solobacterium sp.]|nr:NFACT family protein [Solobacterium sp.]
LRLYGELLTANMSMLTQGAKEVTVTSYYDGSEVTIPLDPRWSPSKNAQSYYKRYAKSKTAVKEKNRQLDDTNENIEYLESCLAFIENAQSIAELETLRTELEETGFIRRRHAAGRKPPRFKANPRQYETTDGFVALVGRNNRENDVLTLEMASRGDYWLHTKDIPGSHVILKSGGHDVTETAILEAAGLAALYSKAKGSENVPVDYVPVRYVKKPSGARPGKVIFTHNRTVYVDPGEPDKK